MQGKVKLYSNNCPKCKILKMQLDKFLIEYEVVTDFEKLISNGFTSLPVLEVQDRQFNEYLLNFDQAMNYIIDGGEEN